MADQPVLFKIRALLSNAEDEANPPELREQFLAKAHDLIAKHSIDAAVLASTGARPDELTHKIIDLPTGPYHGQRLMLLNDVAHTLGVRSIRLLKVGKVRPVDLIGWRSDVETVEHLYASLLLQATAAMGRKSAVVDMNARCTHPAHKVAWRNAFMEGFRTEVVGRLRDARKAATTKAQQTAPSGTSVAVVLADRSRLVSGEVRRLHPRLTTNRLTGGGGGWKTGRDLGVNAGRNADIGGSRLTGTRGALTDGTGKGQMS